MLETLDKRTFQAAAAAPHLWNELSQPLRNIQSWKLLRIQLRHSFLNNFLRREFFDFDTSTDNMSYELLLRSDRRERAAT